MTQTDGGLIGFVPDLLDLLVQASNFTYTLTLQSDKVYGEQFANGSWNGMIARLLAGVCSQSQ